MNYFVKRGEQQYGPYSLATLQQYVAQGNISQQDLARSEAMTDWVPVSTIIGNVVVPTPAAFGTVASGQSVANLPLPPKLHWAVVVFLGIVTVSIFWIIWLFVEAVWIRKVRPESKALYYLLVYLGAAFSAGVFDKSGIGILLQLVSIACYLIAIFKMRSDIEEYFAMLNPVGLSLSAGMTFFFNAAYFQYHLREVRETAEVAAAAATGR
jgi:hypothetical protein